MSIGGPGVTLTDLLRNPNDVLPRLEMGPITVRRRDGEDFCLVRRDHWEALFSSWLAMSSCYLSLRLDRSCPTTRPAEEAIFPWLSFLPDEDQEQCIRDIVQAMIASLETGRLGTLTSTIAEWRATALATWDDQQNQERPGYQDDEPVPLEDC